ncbi:MAG: hypothetical protein EOO75_03300 [Myxococcales bacterium]|nr:MAG: hypothetical protein EOO75_03300 [Myxococcales bacterium]
MARRTTTAEAVARALGERMVTVIDAGGRAAARRTWFRLAPLAVLHGFEVDTTEYERLVRSSVPGVERYERALVGAEPGEAQVSVTDAGEVLAGEPSPLVERLSVLRGRTTRGGGSQRVARVRLDEALTRAAVEEPVFLRLSAGGRELDALVGAGDVLPRLLGVEVDVAFSPLLDDQPLFGAIDAHLRAAGLVLWRLGWPSHGVERHWSHLTHSDTAHFGRIPTERAAGSGRLLRARALYLRDHVELPEATASDRLRLATLAALCDAAGEIDMAASCLHRLVDRRGLIDELARPALVAHLRQLERE